MKYFIFIQAIFCIVSMAGFIVSPGWSQEPENGIESIWKGELRLPEKRPESVSFKIANKEESFQILSMKYKSKIYEIQDFAFSQDSLLFNWQPGEVTSNCELKQEGQNSYSGNCRFSDSEKTLGMTIWIPITTEGQEGAEITP